MWKVEYNKRFLKELASLPKDIQSRVELIVFSELETDNPFELGYLDKMKGHKDKYKIRVADYRIGLTIDKPNGSLRFGGQNVF
ncbi:MAG: type II toxin-antitoxin system RelE family toxin [Microcystis sp.]|jgi:mRNA interferase RelE/StbE|uniref:type II toxin-antitoxin system RelE family toxin n=1 Tax=unclassified Microcystis TaxID=2643300 RepID=UPI0022BA8C23|nr:MULTISPECIES: type II toxin-antitoxin system RelE/ParE family toxin [unclassified Microcystis]MCE2670765.1 type II toxin-antitoxin system RelE/ParE family toxin [Microcystis sp. 49638_E5]MCZ8058351.1 type II toxin-antitoxin system RelE/ParE family toxin [Microcystis sp. LE19-12.2C]MDJ0550347.1 type II toxin-antitoxin system RelE/ParE family toxin [Microcystis sp. M49637_WE12]MDJ0587333.1 type II toxin-antitoxin system RelE/ParE family toxin [Microcystis sp. M49636_WE2]